MVPRPVSRLIIFDTETTGVVAWIVHGFRIYASRRRNALRVLAGGLRAAQALASSFCLCSSISSITFFLPLILLPPPQLPSRALSTWTTGRMYKRTCPFFYSKRPTSPPKTEVLLEKNCLFLLKKSSQPRKKLKFCMKRRQKSAKKVPKRAPIPSKI